MDFKNTSLLNKITFVIAIIALILSGLSYINITKDYEYDYEYSEKVSSKCELRKFGSQKWTYYSYPDRQGWEWGESENVYICVYKGLEESD